MTISEFESNDKCELASLKLQIGHDCDSKL